jgi:predicted Fe-Mo cluster-binding NifX family protein
MKIAVTSQNFRTVTPHAGRTRRFLVYEATVGGGPMEVDRLDLPKELSMHEFHADSPHPLDAVDVIIAGSFGEGFATRMEVRGIVVVATDVTDPLEAVTEYLARPRSGGQTAARTTSGCEHGHGRAHQHAHANGHRYGHGYGLAHGAGRAGMHRGYRVLDAAIPEGEKSNE